MVLTIRSDLEGQVQEFANSTTQAITGKATRAPQVHRVLFEAGEPDPGAARADQPQRLAPDPSGRRDRRADGVEGLEQPEQALRPRVAGLRRKEESAPRFPKAYRHLRTRKVL